MVVSCVAGQGVIPEAIAAFLGSPMWLPLSRLTYCVYIVHPALIYGYYSMLTEPEVFSDRHVAVNFVFFSVTSYAVATVMHLLIERPAGALLDLLLPPVLSPKSIWRQREEVKHQDQAPNTLGNPLVPPSPGGPVMAV